MDLVVNGPGVDITVTNSLNADLQPVLDLLEGITQQMSELATEVTALQQAVANVVQNFNPQLQQLQSALAAAQAADVSDKAALDQAHADAQAAVSNITSQVDALNQLVSSAPATPPAAPAGTDVPAPDQAPPVDTTNQPAPATPADGSTPAPTSDQPASPPADTSGSAGV